MAISNTITKMYVIHCKCGATCHARGSYDPETNATEIDDKQTLEWEGGQEGCEHDIDMIGDEVDDYDPTDYM